MKIVSNELNEAQYKKAREGMIAIRAFFRSTVANYKSMLEQGHPVPDSVIAHMQTNADAINVFFPGLDEVPAVEEDPAPEEGGNEPPPAPVA